MWVDKAIENFFELSKEEIKFLMNKEYGYIPNFKTDIWYTFEVYPRYHKEPKTMQDRLNYLALRGIIKRGNLLIL